MNTIQTCPICRKTVKPPARSQIKEPNFFPFCSERCKLIDLGAWLDASYKVVSSLQSQESDLSADRNLSETDIQ